MRNKLNNNLKDSDFLKLDNPYALFEIFDLLLSEQNNNSKSVEPTILSILDDEKALSAIKKDSAYLTLFRSIITLSDIEDSSIENLNIEDSKKNEFINSNNNFNLKNEEPSFSYHFFSKSTSMISETESNENNADCFNRCIIL